MNIDYRKRAQKIVIQRKLTSLMTNTKWEDLCLAMQKEMPFFSPFAVKYLDEEYEPLFDGRSATWHELGRGIPFAFIEYLLVKPQKMNVEPPYEVVEATKELAQILIKYAIPMETCNGFYKITGYR